MLNVTSTVPTTTSAATGQLVALPGQTTGPGCRVPLGPSRSPGQALLRSDGRRSIARPSLNHRVRASRVAAAWLGPSPTAAARYIIMAKAWVYQDPKQV